MTSDYARRDNALVDTPVVSPPAAQTDAVELALANAGELLREVAIHVRRNPGLDPDTVRHTLALLRLDPLTRLNRSLLRGRAAAAYRT